MNHPEILKLLAQTSIDILCQNANGSNALHIAVKRQNIEVIKTLLELKFPLNIPKNNGIAALGIAAHV